MLQKMILHIVGSVGGKVVFDEMVGPFTEDGASKWLNENGFESSEVNSGERSDKDSYLHVESKDLLYVTEVRASVILIYHPTNVKIADYSSGNYRW